MLLARHKRKGFLHRIVTDDEKWNPLRYELKEEEIMGTTWPCFNIDSQAEYWKKTHVVYLVGSAWYHVLSAQTERDHYWGTLPNTIDEIEPSTQGKRAHYYSKHDKFILLHDNARPHVAAPVKTYLETLKWEVLPPPAVFSSHCSFRLLLVSIDAWPV